MNLKWREQKIPRLHWNWKLKILVGAAASVLPECLPAPTTNFSSTKVFQFLQTLELEAGQEYVTMIDGNSAGSVKTNLGGKLNLSVELNVGQVSTL